MQKGYRLMTIILTSRQERTKDIADKTKKWSVLLGRKKQQYASVHLDYKFGEGGTIFYKNRN